MNLTKSLIQLKLSDIIRSTLPGMISSGIMYLSLLASSFLLFKEYSLLNMMLIILVGIITYILCILFDKSNITTQFKTYVLNDIRRIYFR
jgi:hypothetical protein